MTTKHMIRVTGALSFLLAKINSRRLNYIVGRRNTFRGLLRTVTVTYGLISLYIDVFSVVYNNENQTKKDISKISKMKYFIKRSLIIL